MTAKDQNQDVVTNSSASAPAGATAVFRGFLEGFWETGTEGVWWTLEEEPFKGYEGLHTLENGDELIVFNADGSVLWQGIIDLEYETGYIPYPTNPQYGQQAALGFWVHGCQRGFAIDDWAYMFFGPLLREPRYTERLRAELRKAVKPTAAPAAAPVAPAQSSEPPSAPASDDQG